LYINNFVYYYIIIALSFIHLFVHIKKDIERLNNRVSLNYLLQMDGTYILQQTEKVHLLKRLARRIPFFSFHPSRSIFFLRSFHFSWREFFVSRG